MNKINVKEIYFLDCAGIDVQGFNVPGKIVFELVDGQSVSVCADNYVVMRCTLCGKLTSDIVSSGINAKCRNCYANILAKKEA